MIRSFRDWEIPIVVAANAVARIGGRENGGNEPPVIRDLPFSKQNGYFDAYSFRTVVQHCTVLAHSNTETTQIWGKEFPGCMQIMKPGNSSFLSVLSLSLVLRPTDSALPRQTSR
jgi:hypothetical protein